MHGTQAGENATRARRFPRVGPKSSWWPRHQPRGGLEGRARFARINRKRPTRRRLYPRSPLTARGKKGRRVQSGRTDDGEAGGALERSWASACRARRLAGSKFPPGPAPYRNLWHGERSHRATANGKTAERGAGRRARPAAVVRRVCVLGAVPACERRRPCSAPALRVVITNRPVLHLVRACIRRTMQ